MGVVLAPTIASGIAGGALAAVVAPRFKITLALVSGLVLAGSLLAILVLSGHFPLLGRNPVFWYWPAWFVPAFYLGGITGKILR